MKKISIVLLSVLAAVSLVSLASVSPVRAQGEEVTSFRNVTVSVYPEYDDLLQLGYPSVLVMIEGEIVSANLPATIRFLVPSDAAMYSAGSGPRNAYQGGPPNRVSSNISGMDEISYELKTKYFVVEYYVPITGQQDRIVAYDFYPMYPGTSLRAIVQQPKRSTNFTVSPAGRMTTDVDGFMVHTYTYPNVSPDKPLHFDISYTKKDSRPSLGGTGGSVNTTAILVVLGVIVVLTGGFILVSKLKSRRPAATRPLRRQAARASKREQSSSKSKYCSKCGKAADGSNRFCAYCGNELD